MRVGRLAYRVRQFASALRGGLEDNQRADVSDVLTSVQRSLFFQMAPAYQRHCYAVHKKLVAAGCDDVHALQAALLHDVGKGQLGLVYRVAVVLLSWLSPGLLRSLSQERPHSWRYPFFVAVRHAELGARRLEESGCEPGLIDIVRRHHTPTLGEGWLRPLQEIDADS